MIEKKPEYHQQLEKNFVSDYLTGTSVESLATSYPFSIAEGYRLLDRWEVIKLVGRKNRSFGKAIYFLTQLVLTKLPLELLYYRYMPPTFRETISRSTLHRIARYARRGLTRTRGTALLISPDSDENKILVAKDVSIPNPALGKSYGALSYPMTYSVDGEPPTISIGRVIQQEVLTNLVIARRLPLNELIQDYTSIGHILIGDVDVSIYRLTLPAPIFDHLSSFKLTDFHFLSPEEIAASPTLEPSVRAGIPEIAKAYLSYLHLHDPNQVYISDLNQQLALLPLPNQR